MSGCFFLNTVYIYNNGGIPGDERISTIMFSSSDTMEAVVAAEKHCPIDLLRLSRAVVEASSGKLFGMLFQPKFHGVPFQVDP